MLPALQRRATVYIPVGFAQVKNKYLLSQSRSGQCARLPQ